MRIYIPTSSLNADNILSCESITPAHECRKRNFGYSHFDLLPELEYFSKVTLAFSQIPIFHTFDTDRESFAMIVAVDIDDLKKYDIRHIKSVNGVDVFATSTPIHLTPSSTHLIFFDNKAKEYTLHNCSDSAKCKLFDFYKSNFIIADRRFYGESLRAYVEKINVPEIDIIFSENKFDKVKGFIWGYGMGNMLSVPKDVAYLYKIQKRIYDIVSSTRNESHIPASLTVELTHLDNEFSSIDPNQKAIKIAWDRYIKDVSERYLHADLEVSKIEGFLNELGAESFVKTKFLTTNHFVLRKKLSEYSKLGRYGYESYSHDIDDYTERLINEVRSKIAFEPFSESLDVDTSSYDTVMMSAENRASKLFNKILFRVIWNNLIPSLEELRVNKAIVAKNVVIAIKSIIEELGEQWIDTPIQLYFNDMRKNISEFTEFNINKIDDIVLQSIAAFLLKGEDFDSLKQYLVTNAFSNYRFAFALWGAISWYVAIPRSIIESEFSPKDTAHLFIEAQTALKLSSVISVPASNPNEGTHIPTFQETTPKIEVNSFKNKVISYFEKIKKGKRNQDQMKEELLLALDQLGDSDNSFLFICTLNDFPKWRTTSKAWQEMQAEFCPDYSEQIRKKISSSASQHVDTPPSKSFWNKLGNLFQHGEDIAESNTSYTLRNQASSISRGYKFDFHNIEPIMSLISNINPLLSEFALKQIRKDLGWVFDPKYAVGKSQNELIEAFKSVLYTGKTERYSKNGKDMSWKNNAYNCLDIEKTIQAIKNNIS